MAISLHGNFHNQVTSNDVEVVSNALLASVHLGHSTHCVEYAAWLLSKRNEEGEFLLSKVRSLRYTSDTLHISTFFVIFVKRQY